MMPLPAYPLESPAIWPWEAEPYQLWSLLDMYRISVGFAHALMDVARFNVEAYLLGDRPGNDSLAQLIEALEVLGRELQPLRLPGTFLSRLKRATERAKDSNATRAVVVSIVNDLQMGAIEELMAYEFFAVPPTRRQLYVAPETWFGEHVLARFRVSRDVRDACQCFAFAQWTACVFHSMRILEHGLRDLAGQVGVTPSEPLELESWKKIIDQIEKAIRQMEALPKTQQKAEDLQFYSMAAVEFRYFKDAWRNHVSHARSDYDEQDAWRVLSHVRDFMRHLASR